MQRLFMTEHGDPISAVTGDEAKQILGRIARANTPGNAAMVESGARSVLPEVYQMLDRSIGEHRVLIVCGRGRTGAIGFALGRHLSNRGTDVVVYSTSDGASPEWEHQLLAYQSSAGSYHRGSAGFSEELPIGEQETGSDSGFQIVVDALLGSYEYGTPDAEVVEFLSVLGHFGSRRTNVGATSILSLGIPSGVDPTTGVSSEEAVSADMTICFAFPRTGMSARKCGSIAVADIGIPPISFRKEAVVTYPCQFRGTGLIRLRNFS